MDTPNKFYRFEDSLLHWNYRLQIPVISIRLIEFRLIEETPCGYWIKEDGMFEDFSKERWVSKTAKKRYAYPTQLEAINNFIARKNRQITILDHKLKQAKKACDHGSYIKTHITSIGDIEKTTIDQLRKLSKLSMNNTIV